MEFQDEILAFFHSYVDAFARFDADAVVALWEPVGLFPAATGNFAMDAQEFRGHCGNLMPAYVQASPPRRLPNLANIPVAVVTSEAGYHAAYDHSTVKFLRSAGVETDHIRLEEVGMHGNGHMLMIEQNSDEIAEVLRAWLDGRGLADPLRQAG